MNTSQRIKSISSFFEIKNYLEIGVQLGHTFNALDIPYKVAVDPLFQFDYGSLASEHIKFFEVPSDEYFLKFSGNDIFDLIFLDGLHEFYQVLRDFLNALDHTHKKSVLILDDIFPNDVFSSLVKDPYRFRKMHNPDNLDGSWHGDVYKMMFFIHDFFPQLSYCTINYGFGNPQALIFKLPRADFRPRFNDLEKINRLTYFDLHNNLDVLNLVTEDQAIKILQGFLCKDV
jgi:hypothetical protein